MLLLLLTDELDVDVAIEVLLDLTDVPEACFLFFSSFSLGLRFLMFDFCISGLEAASVVVTLASFFASFSFFLSLLLLLKFLLVVLVRVVQDLSVEGGVMSIF